MIRSLVKGKVMSEIMARCEDEFDKWYSDFEHGDARRALGYKPLIPDIAFIAWKAAWNIAAMGDEGLGTMSSVATLTPSPASDLECAKNAPIKEWNIEKEMEVEKLARAAITDMLDRSATIAPLSAENIQPITHANTSGYSETAERAGMTCDDEGCPHYGNAIRCEPKEGGCVTTVAKQPDDCKKALERWLLDAVWSARYVGKVDVAIVDAWNAGWNARQNEREAVYQCQQGCREYNPICPYCLKKVTDELHHNRRRGRDG